MKCATRKEREAAALEEIAWELTSPHTLEEIAEHLGYTQRGVEIIEARALAKLRRWLRGSDWSEGLQEPSTLHRRLGAVFASNGEAPKREIES